MTTRTTVTRVVALASTLIFAMLSGACSATAAQVQRHSGGGRFALRGPYVPAMEEARARMLEHCQGRFIVREGSDPRDVSYRCAAQTTRELALSGLDRNPQP